MKTKVSIVRCKTYEQAEVRACVERSFELLGGLSSFIKKGENVLLKPNILSASPPEKGVNTHIEVVRAVARLVKKCEAHPIIGDNPGGSIGPKQAYEGSGMLSLADEEGVELADSKDVKMIRGIPFASYFFGCDKIISLPKMKTHSFTCITGAVKNMYGAVAGLHKSQCHKLFPSPEEFVKVLVDIFEIVKPHLVLMDGVIAMDGDGPAAGSLRNAELLIGGQDSVAVDSVFSHLAGVDPLDILSTKEAHRRGIGEAAIEKIEIVGEDIDKCLMKNFKLPRSKVMMSLPSGLLKIVTNFVKFGPYIKEQLCKKCKICAESCPVSCITIDEKKSIIDSRRCIACMCCHEVCPYGAVELKRNILARMAGL